MNKKGLSIRIRKTAEKSRKYSYTFEAAVPREEVTVIVGKDGVTAEWIEHLHYDDDQEVYNNVKNSKAPMDEWEIKAREQWEERHLGEDYPKKWNISLDAGDTDGNAEDAPSCVCGDKRMLLAAPEDEEDKQKMSVRELVATFPKEQQELYRLYFIEEYTKAEIALLLGCSKPNITKRVTRLEEKIKKYFKQG